MSIFDRLGRRSERAPVNDLVALREDIAGIGDSLRSVVGENFELRESIAELELAMEDRGWLLMTHDPQETEFSREGLDKIIRLSRMFWIKNPIIKRGVEVQNLYVWAQGVSIKAPDATIDKVVQAFLADPANAPCVGSYKGRKVLERTRRVDGNVFLRFFTKEETGRVVVRSVNVEQVREIVTDPQDADQPWFYKRVWHEAMPKGEVGTEHVEYYPDWAYLRELEMEGDGLPTTGLPDGAKVDWKTPIYHLKADHLPGWGFGIPETYASIDWARAHKECLEDFKKTVKSLSKWAWSLKGGGGQSAVDAAVAKLNSTLSSFAAETNPAPTGGSVFVGGKDVELEAVDVGNAYVPTDSFRPLLRNAGIGMGLPETFFGDASVGNQATATTLDRPTELQFLDCQTMWRETLSDIFQIVVEKAASAPAYSGIKTSGWDKSTGQIQFDSKVAKGPLGRMVKIDFPPILQRDVAAQISALVRLVTLGNWPIQILDDVPTLLRLGLTWLRVDNVEEIIEKFYPADDSEPKGLHPVPKYEPRQKAAGNNNFGATNPQDGTPPPDGKQDGPPPKVKEYGTAPSAGVTQTKEQADAASLEVSIEALRQAIVDAATQP